ncbi:hypothetical protein SMICM304S_08048 [Streptomyces microflavus]
MESPGCHWMIYLGEGASPLRRIKRALIDLLLSYWLTIHGRREILIEHLFVDFKTWLAESGALAAETIPDIRHYADTYQAMHKLPMTDPTAQLLDRDAGHFDCDTMAGLVVPPRH